MGIPHVEASPLTRSSYHARQAAAGAARGRRPVDIAVVARSPGRARPRPRLLPGRGRVVRMSGGRRGSARLERVRQRMSDSRRRRPAAVARRRPALAHRLRGHAPRAAHHAGPPGRRRGTPGRAPAGGAPGGGAAGRVRPAALGRERGPGRASSPAWSAVADSWPSPTGPGRRSSWPCRRRLPAPTWRPSSVGHRPLRAVKDDAEIEALAAASRGRRSGRRPAAGRRHPAHRAHRGEVSPGHRPPPDRRGPPAGQLRHRRQRAQLGQPPPRRRRPGDRRRARRWCATSAAPWTATARTSPAPSGPGPPSSRGARAVRRAPGAQAARWRPRSSAPPARTSTRPPGGDHRGGLRRASSTAPATASAWRSTRTPTSSPATACRWPPATPSRSSPGSISPGASAPGSRTSSWPPTTGRALNRSATT